MPASDRMLRGRSPWGLGGAVYLLVRSFVCIRSCVNVRGRRCFLLGVGGCYQMLFIHVGLHRCLVKEQCGSCYRERVPTVVIFEISPSYVKTFHYRPQRSQPPPDPTRTRCATSLRWLCSRQVHRPSHLVQVQSPISTARINIIRLDN